MNIVLSCVLLLVIENRTIKITMINIKLKINSVKKYFSISLKIEVRVTYALTIQSNFY